MLGHLKFLEEKINLMEIYGNLLVTRQANGELCQNASRKKVGGSSFYRFVNTKKYNYIVWSYVFLEL